jgi:hypothetical protein
MHDSGGSSHNKEMTGGHDSNNFMHTIAYEIYIATSVDYYTDDVQTCVFLLYYYKL